MFIDCGRCLRQKELGGVGQDRIIMAAVNTTVPCHGCPRTINIFWAWLKIQDIAAITIRRSWRRSWPAIERWKICDHQEMVFIERAFPFLIEFIRPADHFSSSAENFMGEISVTPDRRRGSEAKQATWCMAVGMSGPPAVPAGPLSSAGEDLAPSPSHAMRLFAHIITGVPAISLTTATCSRHGGLSDGDISEGRKTDSLFTAT